MQADKTHDVISVTDLRILTRIGVLEFEKSWSQTLRISFDMLVPSSVRKAGDYVSYAPVVDELRALAKRDEHVELIETFAEMVAQKLLADKRVKAVRVRIQKEDVYPDADAVGITIYAEQGDFASN